MATVNEQVNAKLDALEAAFAEIEKDVRELQAAAAPQLDAATNARFDALVAKFTDLGVATDAGAGGGGTPTDPGPGGGEA